MKHAAQGRPADKLRGMSPEHDASRLPAEARARLLIDRQLGEAGWSVQDKKAMNLFAAPGVAIREVTLKPGHGRADYLLYVDQSVVGVIEAKPEGTPLSGVEWQSATYAEGLPADVRLAALTKDGRLPFVFEASGTETHFTNGFDPEPRARRVFQFPKPSTLGGILTGKDAEHPTWRGKVRALPPLDEKPLRPAQITAINGVEQSLAEQRYDRSLVQMATGAGKTYTAATLSYRLLKHGGFTRILFLVDRNSLAKQTMAEYENYQTPDDSRKFTELYNVTRLRRDPMPDATDVAISTIQRVFRALRNEEVADTDDPELDGWVPDEPVTVAYNPDLPPETFDLIVVDEAHRSIYGQWRGASNTSTRTSSALPPPRASRPSGSSSRTSSRNTRTRSRWPTTSTSTSTSTGSGPGSASRAPRSKRAPSSPRSLAGPAPSGSRPSTTISNTRPGSSTGPSPRPTRSAPCSRRSATGCSRRSSPAARWVRRR
jgi:type I restriction enzyme R subunit